MRLQPTLLMVLVLTTFGQVALADFDTLVGNPPESEPPVDSKWRQIHKQAREALEKNDLDGAEKYWKDAVWEAEHANPPEIEPGVVNCLVGLAFVYDKKGNFGESERVYELAMRNMEGLVSRGHPRFSDYMADLGDLYQRHNRADQGEVMYKDLLDFRQKKAEYDDEKSKPERIESYMKWAEALDRYARYLRRTGMNSEANLFENRAKAIRTSVQSDNTKGLQ